MIAIEYNPLRFPKPWPPPAFPDRSGEKIGLERVPVFGWFVRYWQRFRQSQLHMKNVLDPIADQIVQQLESRPSICEWPGTEIERQIVLKISETICLEKGLDFPPALHPDDPLILLFWGPFDDISFLVVKCDLEKQLSIQIPVDTLLRFADENWTVRKFIDYCAQRMSA